MADSWFTNGVKGVSGWLTNVSGYGPRTEAALDYMFRGDMIGLGALGERATYTKASIQARNALGHAYASAIAVVDFDEFAGSFGSPALGTVYSGILGVGRELNRFSKMFNKVGTEVDFYKEEIGSECILPTTYLYDRS